MIIAGLNCLFFVHPLSKLSIFCPVLPLPKGEAIHVTATVDILAIAAEPVAITVPQPDASPHAVTDPTLRGCAAAA
eukprot:COSAG02_NODE_33294_length_502_cov_0.992556_1_plen_75_part_10